MRPSPVLLAGALVAAVHAQTRSDKRGLVFVPNADTPEDNGIWVQDGSDLAWYYNYGPRPAPAYADEAQGDFEFVPMLFGNIDDTSFLDTVNSLIDEGRDISHVLTFNEPDGPTQYGGSDIPPAKAAQVWVDNIIPLQEKGVKAGLPGCTGGTGGIPWLRDFLGNCSELISPDGDMQNCTYDFVSIHWYGNFEGLASHLGEYSAAFPDAPQWITEYNLNDQDLSTTQSFFNTSLEYLDRLENVERYNYFGSFRSSVSNVGPNAVMLNNAGELTDIGSWYLGGSATGVDPQSGLAARGQVNRVLAATLVCLGSIIVLI